MTITYDPKSAKYYNEADVRNEMTRVFDVCQGCRLCFDLCASFPTLFEMIDRHDDHDAGRLTPAQQDQVVDECFQCKLCHVNCPYTPGSSVLAIDFPRLMLRVDAMRHANSQVTIRDRVTDTLMGHTDVLGKAASLTAPFVNKVLGNKPGSPVRKALEAVTGVSSVRLLAPYARQRFTTWFKRRPRVRIAQRQGRVAVFPTCLVEYQQPSIGHDLVKVYERNGIECALADDTTCCGALWLYSGDVEQFTRVARKNVKALATSVRRGNDIVVPQPTCGYILKKDYVDYVGGPDAQLVAEHTYDAAEYLMRVHKADGTTLDTDFAGHVPETVTYHTPCHLLAQNVGLKSRDLIKLTGARVTVVQQCSGMGALWGMRAKNDEISLPIAEKLAGLVRQADGEVIAGDCHLANTAIAEQTGEQPVHPLQLIARAYGISEEVAPR
ncbi:MAG: heterodisulfide reductase-related iron-sulfur binding cluster [Ilumatobacteraceae bacterium]